MGFHETTFPEDISYGSSGGPGWMTNLIEMSGGQEQSIPRWSEARHHFNAKYGVKRYDQLAALKVFYMARQGPANGFRYKDWQDCTTNTLTPGIVAETESLGATTPTDSVSATMPGDKV